MENHLKGITRTDLASIKALKKPPEIVQNILTAIFCILSGTKKKPEFDDKSGKEGVRQMISKNDFISRLFAFQAIDLDPDIAKLMKKRYFKEETLTGTIAAAERASKAVGLLARWASNQVEVAASMESKGDTASTETEEAGSEGKKPASPEVMVKSGRASPSSGRSTPTGGRSTPTGSRCSSRVGGFSSSTGTAPRAKAPLLGFSTIAAANDKAAKEKEALEAKKRAEREKREPLPDAAFTLLRSKYQQVSGKIEELEVDQGESKSVRQKARAQLDKLEEEAQSVLKVLEELDINPDAWDNKLRNVKEALMANMTGSQCRRVIFQWWENMAHTHVGYMGKTVAKKVETGEFGLKVKPPNACLGTGTGYIPTMPKWERRELR